MNNWKRVSETCIDVGNGVLVDILPIKHFIESKSWPAHSPHSLFKCVIKSFSKDDFDDPKYRHYLQYNLCNLSIYKVPYIDDVVWREAYKNYKYYRTNEGVVLWSFKGLYIMQPTKHRLLTRSWYDDAGKVVELDKLERINDILVL